MDRNTIIEKISDGLKMWTKFSLLWLLLTIVLRLAFFFMLKSAATVDWSDFSTVLSGVYFDLALVLFVSSITLIPVLIINWLLPKTTKVLSIVFITLYVMVYCSLIGYFVNVTKPLDRVFFIYTPEELYDIVVSSVRFSFWSLFGVLASVVLYSMLLRLWDRKVKINGWLAFSYLVVTILFVICFNYKSLITNERPYKSHQDYCLAVNQVAYTIHDFNEYNEQNKSEDFSDYDGSVLRDAVAYQSRFPEFKYIDIHYPFLRLNNDPDVLGGFLNKTSDGKAPNYVFIIVESLGQRLSSTEPKMSFTPFLDSLKTESLYWPNALSLAERTFGVLPNVFSSAPYDKLGFARVWWTIPDHNSILKDMSNNGYSLSFYYGGNASFDGQNTYMAGNGVGYIMDPMEAEFDQEQKEDLLNNNSWGMYDRDLFNATIRHRDTVDRNRPNTDVFITLSTHEPFYFKGQEPYIEKVHQMLAETPEFGPKEKENVTKNDYMYATYLYTDECLKGLFDYYKTQPEYENTVFVIVGDHRTGCVLVNQNPMLVYNVPLIIYSPLLKSPKTFRGVVTHHDLAPTITAYLSKNYDYQVDNVCHWLGKSLDTSAVYNCEQSVAFMLNNRDVVEYLHHDYFICRDRLYKVNDSINLYEIDNDSIKNQLKEYLRQYRNIDKYVTQNNLLLQKPYNMIELLNSVDMNVVGYHIDKDCRQDIGRTVDIDEDYQRIYVDVKFAYRINNNADPKNIFLEFFGKTYRFSELSTKADFGAVLRVKTSFNVNDKDMAKMPMNISIYSKQDVDLDLYDVRLKVEGL